LAKFDRGSCTEITGNAGCWNGEVALLVLSMPGGPGSQATPDHTQLDQVNKLAEEEEGKPEWGKWQASYHHLLLHLLLISEEGKGGGEEVVEREEGGEDAGADEDVLEQPQVGRVGPVDGRSGQEGEGQGEQPEKFLGLGKWGRGKGQVCRDVQQVEEGGQEPGKVQAAHQVVHSKKNS